MAGSLNSLIIGRHAADFFPGVVDEVVIMNEVVSDNWVTTDTKSLNDNLITFYTTNFLYSNSYPKDDIKMYGLSQSLKSTVTVSGGYASYNYDSNFYHSTGHFIDTVSGTSSGNEVHVSLDTLSGTTYSWYLETTSSGVTDRSPDYNFYVRYLCSGICENYNTPASGIKVRLYRKSSGVLLGETTTAGTGTFSIDTSLNEEHYAVALHPDVGINALIYDHLSP